MRAHSAGVLELDGYVGVVQSQRLGLRLCASRRHSR